MNKSDNIKKIKIIISYYKTLKALFPKAMGKKLDIKIKKYEKRLVEALGEFEFFTKNPDMYFNNLSKLNKVNLELKTTEKKKILIVGTLDIYEQCALYTNILLKNIDYKNTIVHLYDTKIHYTTCINNPQYLQNASYRDILYYMGIENIDASLYDVLIYLSDLKNDIELPLSMPKISYLYCYAYHKNTEDYWAKLNRNFDAFLAPNESILSDLDNIHRTKLLLKPSFDMRFYNNIKNKQSNVITFIAPLKKAYTFSKTFYKIREFLSQNNITVNILYLYREQFLQYFQLEKDSHLQKKIQRYNTPNIKSKCADTVQYFSEIKKYANLSDAIIFTDNFENYICNPRQTLASGKVVFVPENYDLNNDITGIFKYNKSNLIDLIRHYIKNKEEIDKYHIQRKEYANNFSKENLYQYYYSLTNVENIELSAKDEFKDFKMNLKDKNLYMKYKKYIGKEEFTVPENLTIIPISDAGFFSVYNKQVSFLAHKDDEEIIIPDWRISKLVQNTYRYWGYQRLQSFCYGKYSDGNIFLKLFDYPYPNEILNHELYESDIIYDYADKVVDCPEYNFDAEPNLTYIYSYELFKDEDYLKEFRNKYHSAVEKYMKPLPYIQKIIDDFKAKYIDGHFCISINIRCAAHTIELFEPTQFEIYNAKILEVLKLNNIDKNDKNWRLFIATDNDIALNYFKKLYSENIIYQQNITRLSVSDEQEYMTKRLKIKKDIYGYELQHRKSGLDEYRDIKFAVDILTDAYLLACGNYFIYQNSNVSTAVSYLNPNIKMIYAKKENYENINNRYNMKKVCPITCVYGGG